MIISDNGLELNGATLCGSVLAPADDDSLWAVYDLSNVSTGMTYETGAQVPYLRLTPAIQIPEKARNNFKKFLFTTSDERFADMKMDDNDGELTMRRTVRGTDVATIERELADCLDFLDKVAYPAIIAYVREELANKEEEPKTSPFSLFD